MRWRRTRTATQPLIPQQRAISFDCRDGQHVACIPNDAIPGSVPVCACDCHQQGDPALRAAWLAGLRVDPGHPDTRR